MTDTKSTITPEASVAFTSSSSSPSPAPGGTRSFFCDPLLPRYGINIVTGSSGAGKSRWLIPAAYSLLDGELLWGFPLAIAPLQRIAYIGCDRTSASLRATITALGYDPARLLIRSFQDSHEPYSVDSLRRLCAARNSSLPELIIVESLPALMGHGRSILDFHAVLDFAHELNLLITESGTSILGSVFPPKLKRGESYPNVRDNIAGCGAWAGIADTIISISADGQPPQCRIASVSTLTAAPFNIHCHFDSLGRLVPSPSVLPTAANSPLDDLLKPESELATASILAYGKASNLSERTTYSWIAMQLDLGNLSKIARGVYRVTAAPA